MGTFYPSSVVFNQGGFASDVGFPVALSKDHLLDTYHHVIGNQGSGDRTQQQGVWTVSFAGNLPNDGRAIVLKARVALDTSGSAPDKAGEVRLAISGTTLLFDRTSISWNTSTGNISTGPTDLFVSQHNPQPGLGPQVILTSSFLLAHTFTMTITMFPISVFAAHVDARAYEFYVEDGAPPGEIVSALWPGP